MNELPPLPEPIAWFADYGGDVFKADQMRAYARAAIEAHEARKVSPCCMNYAAGTTCFANPRQHCPFITSSPPAPVREPLTDEQIDYLTCDIRKVRYMDIYSGPGTKVVFHGRGGYDSQKEHAKKSLVLGNTYTVKRVEVSLSSSSVKLWEVEGDFNTVLFGPAAHGITKDTP
jgi:hypothetical protein